MNTFEDIKDILIKIGIDSELITEENKYLPLTGNKFNMSSVQLAYLLLEIEKKYDLKINESDLINEGFNTINNIIEIVRRELKKKIRILYLFCYIQDGYPCIKGNYHK